MTPHFLDVSRAQLGQLWLFLYIDMVQQDYCQQWSFISLIMPYNLFQDIALYPLSVPPGTSLAQKTKVHKVLSFPNIRPWKPVE